jgi:hypothetical protein
MALEHHREELTVVSVVVDDEDKWHFEWSSLAGARGVYARASLAASLAPCPALHDLTEDVIPLGDRKVVRRRRRGVASPDLNVSL